MRQVLLVCLLLLMFPHTKLKATWSIVLADSETGEVGVGTITCLNNFDLLAIVPVIVVGKGAAAVQASGDFEGIRRPVIFDGLLNGTPVDDILDQVANIAGHQSRQYGIVNTNGEAVTFSGDQTFSWTGGVTGSVNSIHYAIQGNILSGPCVVNDIETALRVTQGDMADKLMAGMQAAKLGGGDGRCSCPGPDPEGCGCPPSNFEKSGHIGGMVIARPGDTDDTVCDQDGCADGTYFMRLNSAFQPSANPDPVDQLQMQFDDFRQANLGIADAGTTVVEFVPPMVPPNGVSEIEIKLTAKDYRGEPITAGFLNGGQAIHAPDSSGGSQILDFVNIPFGGIIQYPMIAASEAVTDRFIVRFNTAEGATVQVMRNPELVYPVLGDLNGDGNVSLGDLILLISDSGPCVAGNLCLGDIDGNQAINAQDVNRLLPLLLVK